MPASFHKSHRAELVAVRAGTRCTGIPILSSCPILSYLRICHTLDFARQVSPSIKCPYSHSCCLLHSSLSHGPFRPPPKPPSRSIAKTERAMAVVCRRLGLPRSTPRADIGTTRFPGTMLPTYSTITGARMTWGGWVTTVRPVDTGGTTLVDLTKNTGVDTEADATTPRASSERS